MSAIKNSRKKRRSTTTDAAKGPKKPTLKLPHELKVIASEAASEALNMKSSPVLESTPKKEECQSDDFAAVASTTNNEDDKSEQEKVGTATDFLFDGEMYCVIDNPSQDKDSTDETSEAQDKDEYQITEDSLPQVHDESPQNLGKTSSSDTMTSDTSPPCKSTITSTKREELSSPSPMNSKSKPVERSCKITCVTILKDEKTNDKFIVAGVKIESHKTRRNKEHHKHKLSLLVYKIAGK